MGFYERLRETFDADTVELTRDLTHAADRVVIRWIWHAQGHGPEANMELTTIFTVRNGKVREAEYFWDHNEALKAAGLSE
jgi:ketosteroid isomerase-like protein